MNEQLSIKVISRGNTEKTIFTLDKGNAYSTKVAPNTIYQLIDNATKRGPDYVKVNNAVGRVIGLGDGLVNVVGTQNRLHTDDGARNNHADDGQCDGQLNQAVATL